MARVNDTYKGGKVFQIDSIKGSSTALNTQRGEGGHKPDWRGNTSPGDTNPGYDGDNIPTPSVVIP